MRRAPSLVPVLAALLLAAVPVQAGDSPRGYPARGRLGVEVQGMTAELREFFQAPADNGVLVVRVVEGLPAQQAGLEVGDVIVAAAREPLEHPHDLVAIVARAPAGRSIPLDVVRRGQLQHVDVTPAGDPIPGDALQAWHARSFAAPPSGAPGADVSGSDGGEVSRRLEAIEHRLEAIERGLGAPPAPATPAPDASAPTPEQD